MLNGPENIARRAFVVGVLTGGVLMASGVYLEHRLGTAGFNPVISPARNPDNNTGKEKQTPGQVTELDRPTPVPVIPVRTLLPIQQSLFATATAVARRRESSFVPEGEFTDEIFEYVRRGTFVIEVERAKDRVRATAWLAGLGSNELYIATAGHVFSSNNPDLSFKSVTLYRPGIDVTKNSFTDLAGAVLYPEPDNALIKIRGNYPTQTPLQPLKFEDAVVPQRGEGVLMVGFPWEFEIPNSDSNFIASGGTFRADQPQLTEEPLKYWYSFGGIADGGSSGSPIVRLDKDKKPVVIAMHKAGGKDVEIKDANGNITKQYLMFNTPLYLGPLKQDIDRIDT